ncbi:MAG: SnoaL-like domain-containing protein [Ginsengibacter sp.]
MTTKEIAILLVEMCRAGKVEEAKEELFAEDVISIEPAEGLLAKETKGMEAIRKKAELFISHVENFYGVVLSEPVIAGDYFSISWDTDIQMKGQERKTDSELCLYKVKDGKIISEQFFY